MCDPGARSRADSHPPPLAVYSSAPLHRQCYMNGVLSTLVSLLILFRSLDGSSPAARRLQALFPFLPLPPSVGLRSNGKEAGAQRVTHEFKQTTTEMLKGKKPSDGDEELPVMVQLANERRAEGEREREENGEKDWIRRDSEATIL